MVKDYGRLPLSFEPNYGRFDAAGGGLVHGWSARQPVPVVGLDTGRQHPRLVRLVPQMKAARPDLISQNDSARQATVKGVYLTKPGDRKMEILVRERVRGRVPGKPWYHHTGCEPPVVHRRAHVEKNLAARRRTVCGEPRVNEEEAEC